MIQFAGCAPLRATAASCARSASTRLKRSPLLPDVPTVAEQGMPGFVSYNWNGVLAPAGTPQAIIDPHLRRAGKQLATPASRKQLLKPGPRSWPATGRRNTRPSCSAEIEKWANVARTAGIPKI